jgi:hypothetical protein
MAHGRFQKIMSILNDMGLDPNDIEWYDLAACRDLPDNMINLFFDDYEEDKVVAEQADNMCLSCPVAKACLIDGEDNNSYGVWGGLYLTSGKIDKNKNSHKFNADGSKTDALKKLEGIHGRSFKIRQNNG